MLGIDCTSYPSAQAVRDAGMSFVWGYLSNPGNRKNITRAKVAEYAAADIGVPLIWETTAARAGQGYSAGIADANAGIQGQAALGIPPEYEIYYAVDYDATGPAVLPYFQGLAAVPGDDSGYGGIKVISYLLDQLMIHHAWQTAAWSRGLIDPRAAVFQRIGTRFIDGIACDVDEAFIPYFGQYPFKESAMELTGTSLAWVEDILRRVQQLTLNGGQPVDLNTISDWRVGGNFTKLKESIVGTADAGLTKTVNDLAADVAAIKSMLVQLIGTGATVVGEGAITLKIK